MDDIHTLHLSYSIPIQKIGVFMKDLIIALRAALGVRGSAGLDYRAYRRI
jgi:hypothetical protein